HPHRSQLSLASPSLLLFPAHCPFCSSFFFSMLRRPPISPLFPYTTLFRSCRRRLLRRRATRVDNRCRHDDRGDDHPAPRVHNARSEEHTSELQSLTNLVCRLLLEKKKKKCRTATRCILQTYSS